MLSQMLGHSFCSQAWDKCNFPHLAKGCGGLFWGGVVANEGAGLPLLASLLTW